MNEMNFSHGMKSSVKFIEKETERANLEIREKKLKRKPSKELEMIEGDDNEKFLNQLLELKKQNKIENEEPKKEEPETIWKVNEKQIILKEVRKNGYSLAHTTDKFKDDEEIVLESIKNGVRALQFASLRLRSERNFVLKAVAVSGYSLKYISQNLKNDHEIVLRAVTQEPYAIKYAPKLIQEKQEIIFVAASRNAEFMEFAPKKLTEDYDFCLKMLKENGICLRYFDEELKSNKNLVMEAMKNQLDSYHDASLEIQQDKEVEWMSKKYFKSIQSIKLKNIQFLWLKFY
jgi:hypothetical protein